MLPDSKIDDAKAVSAPFMFVDTGGPRLFLAACYPGADRRRLVVKVAGGAQLLDQQGTFNIGIRNFNAVGIQPAQNGLKAHGTDLGSLSSRTVRRDLTTGLVTVKTPGTNPCPL